MGEKDGYASLIKQLTSPQITLPSRKFNCVRKRCDYGPISFESESAKSICNHTCIKNGPNAQPNKSRFKHKFKTWAYAMGTIWEPWQSQLSLLQKRILVRVPELYWYILRGQASFHTSCTLSLPCFLPQSLLWRFKVKFRTLPEGMDETDQYHRGPTCQSHPWKEKALEPVSPFEELAGLHCSYRWTLCEGDTRSSNIQNPGLHYSAKLCKSRSNVTPVSYIVCPPWQLPSQNSTHHIFSAKFYPTDKLFFQIFLF